MKQNFFINGYIQPGKNIYTAIPILEKSEKYKNKFEIIEGELFYIGENDTENEWGKENGLETLSDIPKIFINIDQSKVNSGIDIEYNLNIVCAKEMEEPIFNNDNIKVINNSGEELLIQPSIITNVSGTEYRKTAKIIINTIDMNKGTYKIKILAGSVKTIENKSNEELISSGSFELINLQINKPTINAIPNSITNQNVTVTLSGKQDNTYKIEYSTDGVNYQIYTTELSITNNLTVYARIVDSSNNVSEISSLIISNIDKQSPQILFETNGANNVEEANTKVTFNDLGIGGILKAEYVWSSNTTEPTSGWVAFTNNENIVYNIKGTYYLWVKVTDNAGNISTVMSNSFVIIDITPPVSPILTSSITDWINSNLNVTITYSLDSQTKQYSTDGVNWNLYTTPISITTSGVTVYARGSDNSGNISEISSLLINNIDKTLPIAGTMIMKLGSVAGADYTDNTWTNQSIYLAPVNGSDALSGHSTTTYAVSGANIVASTSSANTITNAGISTVIITTKDIAGNISTRTYTIKIDKTPPPLPTFGLSTSAWTNSNITLTITYTSTLLQQYSLDGTNWNTYSSALIINNNTTIYARAYDESLNMSSSSIMITNIDKTLPQNAILSFSTTGDKINGTITIGDGQSGINVSQSKYIITTQSTVYGISDTIWNSAIVMGTTSKTISETKTDETYYVQVLSTDNSGNKIVNVSSSIIVKDLPVIGKTLQEYTWAEIIKIADLDLADDYFNVGDNINITLSSGEIAKLVILDFNHDDLSSETGKAHITFALGKMLSSNYNAVFSYSYAPPINWANSNMRQYLNTQLINEFPSELSDYIKSVKKYSAQYPYLDQSNFFTTIDKLFMLSWSEVSGGPPSGDAVASGGPEGTLYKAFQYGPNPIDTKKVVDGYTYYDSYLLRSPNFVQWNSFLYVNVMNGYVYPNDCKGLTISPIFAFCI